MAALRAANDSLLAFWGALEDSNATAEIKAFVMAGKYVERLDLFSRFKRPEADFNAPVVRLAFNLDILPEHARGLLCEAVQSVAASIEARGYSAALVERVRAVAPVPALDDDGDVVSAGVAVEA